MTTPRSAKTPRSMPSIWQGSAQRWFLSARILLFTQSFPRKRCRAISRRATASCLVRLYQAKFRNMASRIFVSISLISVSMRMISAFAWSVITATVGLRFRFRCSGAMTGKSNGKDGQRREAGRAGKARKRWSQEQRVCGVCSVVAIGRGNLRKSCCTVNSATRRPLARVALRLLGR